MKDSDAMSRFFNRFGLNYFQDDAHYTRSQWETWRVAFNQLGIRWLTLTASEQRAVPEAFIRALLDAGITPVVHIPARVGSTSLRELAPLLKSYASWGLRHVVVFDRPNLQNNWGIADWSRDALVDRFIDHMLPILHVQAEVGLEAMLPPLEPGGDFWDTVFLEAALSALIERGPEQLIQSFGVCVYSWTNGHPTDWGSGGPDVWPDAKPYQCDKGSQNHIGFRIFEWYQSIINRIVGHDLPLYCLRGGSTHGDDKTQDHISTQIEIFDLVTSSELPANLRCFNFDAFRSDGSTDPDWFNPDGTFGTLAEAISSGSYLRSHQPHRPEGVRVDGKTIQHYALLPRTGTRHAFSVWEKLAPFAVTLHPTIGFSAAEACCAHKVTILADIEEIPLEVERQIEAQGCEVTRIDIQAEQKLLDAITDYANEFNKVGGNHG